MLLKLCSEDIKYFNVYFPLDSTLNSLHVYFIKAQTIKHKLKQFKYSEISTKLLFVRFIAFLFHVIFYDFSALNI